MGSYGSYVLPNLLKRGLSGRKVGIDFKKCESIPGVEFIQGDLTSTGLPDNSFDSITCLSVIEHGVNHQTFVSEASRLLRTGGVLYITFDYWKEKIRTSSGGEWDILDRRDVERLISMLESSNLWLLEQFNWSTAEKVIHHVGLDYTFGIITCRKV